MTGWALIKALEARLRVARAKYEYRRKQRVEWSVREARSRKMSHPEALKRAQAEVKKWGRLEGEEARNVRALAARLALLKPKPTGPVGEGVSVPQTAWNPYRRTIANWVARELGWAYQHGWRGVVTSGLRTYAEQKRLYEIYLHGGNIAARPGSSNHEGYVYPRGAIDTPESSDLNRVLDGKKDRKLLWAETVGLADTVHFSGTGR